MLEVDDLEIHHLADNMSEEEFFAFCRANPDLRIERDKDGKIVVMSPTGTETGSYNTDLITEINLWNRKSKSGKVFDSSTGFKLPGGSIRSPDASWVSMEKWDQLSTGERKKFAPICPDFVVELRSETDSLSKLKNKMQEYLESGARLGWLIDLPNQQVYIYRKNGSISLIESFDQAISGEEVLPGFLFDLNLMK